MKLIREDQKTKLTVKLEDNSVHELDCFIKEVEKDRLSLTFPEDKLGYAKYFDEGSEVSVKIFTPSGIKAFDSIVLDSPLEPDFVIEYIEEHTEIQRREYLRCDLKTKFIIERHSGENIITHTLDIGGGGIKFYYDGLFNTDEHAKCRLYLPLQFSSVQAIGNIVKKPHMQKDEHVFIFSNIKNADRDRIIKKCFEIQTADPDEKDAE